MTAETTEIVPLPAHLAQCGCPHGARGRHLTSCQPAREHDSIPLGQRPEYEEGRRFQAISWQYPLRLTATINVDVQIDPAFFIAAHLAEYDDFEPDSEYQEWEKPIVFLTERLTEETDMLGGMSFGGGRHVSSASTSMDEVHSHPRWTAEMTAELDAFLASKRVDPNQSTLDV